MRISDEEDRLIDMLLAEQLGGEETPDVTARVLARAHRPRPPERRIIRLGAKVLAAAVVILAALVGYMAIPERGPGIVPGAGGAGGGLERGSVVVAGDDARQITLGGYCDVRLSAAPSARRGARRPRPSSSSAGRSCARLRARWAASVCGPSSGRFRLLERSSASHSYRRSMR